MNNTKAQKTTRGRQKIEIKKITNKGNRQVTFTKRRGGLFKKAGELCILTDAEVAVIVKSPGGRIFTFAQPNVGTLAERRFGSLRSSPESTVTEDLTKGFNEQYNDVEKELEAEKRRSVLIADSSSRNDDFWWQEPLDGIPLEGLESRVAAMEETIKNMNMKGDEMILMAGSNPTHYSSASLAMNSNSHEIITNDQLANYPFNNQPDHDYSFVPLGFDLGHGHGA